MAEFIMVDSISFGDDGKPHQVEAKKCEVTRSKNKIIDLGEHAYF